MSLGEYVGSGSGTTRLLMRFNGDATDSSGNGNNGTGTNITYGNGGLVKYASFNGMNTSYIQVPDHSSLNITDAITVSLWFNTKNTSGAYIVSKWSYNITPAAQQYELYLRWPDNFLGFAIKTSSGVASVIDTQACETKIWKYVTGVYDGSTLKLYVDGVLKNQSNVTGQIDDPNPKSDLGIGSVINLTTPSKSARFYGYMDELIIESRAWSHSEIIKYYTNTMGRYGTI